MNIFSAPTDRISSTAGRQQFISVKLMMALIAAVLCPCWLFLPHSFFALFPGTSFSLNMVSHVGFFFLKSLSLFHAGCDDIRLGKAYRFRHRYFFIYMGAENIISQLLDVWSRKIKIDSGIDLGAMELPSDECFPTACSPITRSRPLLNPFCLRIIRG